MLNNVQPCVHTSWDLKGEVGGVLKAAAAASAASVRLSTASWCVCCSGPCCWVSPCKVTADIFIRRVFYCPIWSVNSGFSSAFKALNSLNITVPVDKIAVLTLKYKQRTNQPGDWLVHLHLQSIMPCFVNTKQNTKDCRTCSCTSEEHQKIDYAVYCCLDVYYGVYIYHRNHGLLLYKLNYSTNQSYPFFEIIAYLLINHCVINNFLRSPDARCTSGGEVSLCRL